MKLLEPRRKRRVTAVPRPPFPIQIESETGIPASRALWQVYTGIFNGDCIIVDEPHEMDIIFNMGFFGKGSLSRGGPEFGKVKKDLPSFLRNRQWLRRKEWAEEQEKIERAANSECVSKEEVLKVGRDIDNKRGAESENPVKELLAPENCDDITVVTAGPSGNCPQGSGNLNDSKTDFISNVVKANLKEMDVVVLSDDEAPKRHANLKNSQEEIEVIDENFSNSEVSKVDQHASRSSDEGYTANTGNSACLVQNDKNDSVDVSSPVHEPEEKKPAVWPAEEVIEIVETSMDVDVSAVTGCSSGSENKGMAVMQEKEKDDGGESEESDVEEQCKRTVEDSLGCKVLVLPDSDSEDEGYKNYMKNLSARLEWELFPVQETLNLSLEEAYFLSYGLGCLQVLDPFGNALSLIDLWKMFRDAQKDFVPKYVAYHYLRAKGWVVRSGLKYGGDFMLYKQGPVFYHASYVVVVEVLQAEDWSRHPTLNSRSFSWGSMTTLNRVVTAAGKELLICQVIWPTGVPSNGPDSPASFPQFAVNEVLMRRWVASEEREKEEENVDWDGQ